jgi:hypothetical protein
MAHTHGQVGNRNRGIGTADSLPIDNSAVFSDKVGFE